MNIPSLDGGRKLHEKFVPTRLTDTGLSAKYATAGESPVLRFIRGLERPNRDLYVVFAGDSTHLQTDPWPVKLFRDHIGPAYPAWSVVYDKWNDTTQDTDAPVTLQTGTGARTIHVLNLSMSGKTSFYYLTGARWAKFTTYGGCDLLVYSQGFNEQAGADLFAPRYLASIESLRGVYPSTEVVAVAENAGAAPLSQANIDNQATRADSVRGIAAQRGYGLIDNHDLFVKNGTYAADWLQADGIHPNDPGMEAIADAAFNLFRLPKGNRVVPKSIQPPAFTVSDNLLPFGDLAGWDGTGLPPGASAGVGTVTVSKDTGIFETKGYSVKILGGGSGTTDYLPFDVPSELLGRLKNGYVTLAARIYVPTGQAHNNAGRVGLDIANDGQSNVSPNGVTQAGGESYEGTGGWRWASVRIFVKTIGSRVRARIYANLSGDTTGGVVYLDRLAVVQGTVPREVGAARALTQNVTSPTTGFGFPFTVDPATLRGSDTATLTANRAVYMRVRDGGVISKVGLAVATSSGNVSVAVYGNTGTGRAAVPGTLKAASGPVACPAAGYAEIALGSTVTVNPGDWIAICPDNATAAFRSGLSGLLTNNLGLGREFVRDNSFPLAGDNPGSLQASLGPTICMVGV